MQTETQQHEAQPPTTVRVFQQRFSATRKAARLARLLAAHQLHAWGIPYGSDSSDVASLIVAELAANAGTHGRVPGRDFELLLAFDADGLLRIEVTDARTERRLPAPPPVTPPSDTETGRGLLLVAALADTWGVTGRQVGKTVWATLRP